MQVCDDIIGFYYKVLIVFFFFVNLSTLKAADDSNNPYLEYVLTKHELDYAHKDKLNKLYPSDFKVIILI